MFHVKQLRKLLVIAGTTSRELVRSPAFALLVGSAAALAALSPMFAFFHLGEEAKMVVDLGLGTSLIVGLLVGVLGASWAVNEELESLSALAVLAKPVSRTSFLVGKYLGVLAASSIAVAVTGFSLLFTLRALGTDALLFWIAIAVGVGAASLSTAILMKRGVSLRGALVTSFGVAAALVFVALDSYGPLAWVGVEVAGWWWSLLPALVGVVLQVAVLAAVAVALATRITLAANLPIVFAVFVLGQLAGGSGAQGGMRAWMSYIVPDLVAFQFSDAVAEHISSGGDGGAAVPGSILLAAVAVALVYVVGALTVGSALFRRRDME
jgi:ABC-type transport system involved in multi-copper enzyme maturation permease subunit